jgi:hypothetical protein
MMTDFSVAIKQSTDIYICIRRQKNEKLGETSDDLFYDDLLFEMLNALMNGNLDGNSCRCCHTCQEHVSTSENPQVLLSR